VLNVGNLAVFLKTDF